MKIFNNKVLNCKNIKFERVYRTYRYNLTDHVKKMEYYTILLFLNSFTLFEEVSIYYIWSWVRFLWTIISKNHYRISILKFIPPMRITTEIRISWEVQSVRNKNLTSNYIYMYSTLYNVLKHTFGFECTGRKRLTTSSRHACTT